MNNDFEWKPTLKQEKFLSLPLSIKEGFYAGAMNAGKTDVLLMYPIVRGWIKHPKFKGIFLRRTTGELKLEVIPRARDYFRPFGATFNANDGIWTFPREDQYGSGMRNEGALFYFGHCEYEDDVHRYDTFQPNYVAFDELTSFTKWQYLYLTIERCRVPIELKGILPAIVRSASNPGNTGHGWVYERFIKPLPEGGKILQGRGGVKRIFIPATVDDNPHADPQYKADLEALPEAEKRAKKYGDWTAYEGSVFSEFRDRLYPDEPTNALHVIPYFEIPLFWPRFVSIDWGYRAMTYICYFAISPNKRVYLYREQSFIEEKIEVWAPKVKTQLDNEDIKDLVICHSASAQRGQPQTILEQVSQALDRNIQIGSKDRVGALQCTHEFLRWKHVEIPKGALPPYEPEVAEWLLRNKGTDYYKSYVDQYAEKPKPEIPKLQIFDRCKLIIECIRACQYAKNKGDDKPAEDVAEFNGDDPYDALKQGLVVIDMFFEQASDKQKEFDKRVMLEEALKTTGDMTAFYRNSKRLERESVTPAVARYHRRSAPSYRSTLRRM